ncbi:hypothetical protein C8P63_1135 [Melghirimyces profundicolus]|uniref:Uncharacterized protein n=1 Tax=Melghirimyces profundicolus TaxID=1242148 RepID=A0A2T6BSK0_9BACL|nr:hypothetical protein C8P63_1135 [Melghirimyces profundicolus]
MPKEEEAGARPCFSSFLNPFNTMEDYSRFSLSDECEHSETPTGRGVGEFQGDR